MTYKSPIEIIHSQMEIQYENDIYSAVQKVGINVDKDELVKALEYDRNQYQKGYEDAKTLYENTQPYKFEDLEINMFVFDLVKNRVNKIIETFDADCGIPYLKLDDGFGEWFIIEFEENRFFQVQIEVKADD